MTNPNELPTITQSEFDERLEKFAEGMLEDVIKFDEECVKENGPYTSEDEVRMEVVRIALNVPDIRTDPEGSKDYFRKAGKDLMKKSFRIIPTPPM